MKISSGQYSCKGRKPGNQDFHGIYTPTEPQLSGKGIAIALADGISSSAVSHIASESAVVSFLSDYFCTPDAWSVKKSAQRVLMATNAWLHAQTRQSQYRYDLDRGYVCTFSALILKSTTAHLFHAGDTRIYHLRGNSLEQLTEDHRLWVAPDTSYLSRALGMGQHLELDYRELPLAEGDYFLLTTDGVYEHLSTAQILERIAAAADDLDAAARAMVELAYAQGSDDNLTVQLIRVERLAQQQAHELQQQAQALAFAPQLKAGERFDGYHIVRQLHVSSRSHLYLAQDIDSGARVALKLPSVDLQHDQAHLKRLLGEEWIARRINSPHVLKAPAATRPRHYLYGVSEYLEGQSLRQWMRDHPCPSLETVRGMVEQIARGLQALHRLEILHQDLRPENILIDEHGTLKLIDLGSAQVAGLTEQASLADREQLLGTAQYTAPEYFLGERGSPRSEQFALAVITYEMLSSRLPYGAEVAKCRSRTAQHRLRYQPLYRAEADLPIWLDGVLRKALHPDPLKRYADLSEFVFELRQPSRALLEKNRPPLLERNPLLFWQSLCAVLALLLVWLALR
ncbi:bifunctional protein-serine/threonine kinase/phosphatase [Pseudomonas sp. o96-267]|uniref:bifunctional protein-serine/threonine kinase/phosphatase n=1 Tax=Pseudomonas sp. o96-267 TaxID=2479853 RepID=UPI000F79E049|nr:bifunctional protein-serine/threonine kinase/phosphatase [Pseudomonas sp. o96-267]RRV22601.1 bifunctional protein-serine/threonine kinase/phosphatase [Pseudomonas sp. o96-267]